MTTNDQIASRRQALRIGGLGAAAAAFLAACGTKDHSTSGQSGVDPTTTLVTPTVPVAAPSEDDLATELTNLRTATSLELVVAEAYGTYGGKLEDADLQAAAVRFAADHTTLADEFSNAIESAADRVDEPNAWVQENLIDPIAGLMTSDAAIADMFSDLESMLAATYIAAVQEATTGEWRGRFATIASGAARRSAALGGGGTGEAPSSALFPSRDLVSNQAKLAGESEDAAAEGDDTTTTTEGE